MIAIAVVYTPESFINSSILTLLARLYLFSVAFSNLPYLFIQTEGKCARRARAAIGRFDRKRGSDRESVRKTKFSEQTKKCVPFGGRILYSFEG